MSTLPIIAITPGEPAGIGPDLCVGLESPRDAALVLVADPAILQERARELKFRFDVRPWHGRDHAGPGLFVLAVPSPHPVKAGRLDRDHARYVLATLARATDGCLAGEFDALVTGPVHKGNINDAGFPFSGHTEFLAERSGAKQVVMMLAAPGRSPSAAKRRDARERPPDLRVALATTHLPLAEVPRAITRERLTAVLHVLHQDLQNKFGIRHPRIRVLGLNPHAGEGGHLGREEIDVIAPVIRQLQQEGMKLEGPVPADTAFLPESLANTDAVLALYHDQGLPVLKYRDFAHAVNITLGLPFIRTSVDHGTALELAGTGKANPSSLIAAIGIALKMVEPQMNADSKRR